MGGEGMSKSTGIHRGGEAAPVSASLDPSETQVHPLWQQSSAQRRMHARCAAERSRVIDALWSDGDGRWSRRATRMGNCCMSPRVHVQRGVKPIVVMDRCRDRMCPTCQQFRASEIRRKLTTAVMRADSVRFLTLTQVDREDESLSDAIERIMQTWKKFRQRPAFKRAVKGGVFVLEVTHARDAERWHVHLHTLIEGTYWDQRECQHEWSAAAGYPQIVDIRAMHGRQSAIRYITKYLTTAENLAAWSCDRIRDFAVGMHRKRLIDVFGTWRKHRVEDDPEQQPKPVMGEHVIGLGVLEEAIEQQCKVPRQAWSLLRRMHWAFARIMPRKYADPIALDVELSPDEWEDCVELLTWIARNGREPEVKPKPKTQSISTPPLWDEKQHHR